MNYHDSISWGPGVTLESVTRFWCEKAVHYFKDNKAAAARSLGVDVRTLTAKLEKYAADDAEATRAQEERKQKEEEWLLKSRGQLPAGQFDHAASKEVPAPQGGLNPVTPIEVKEPPKTHKSPMPGQPAKAPAPQPKIQKRA